MSKKITIEQLTRAISNSPQYVKEEGQKFLQRGLSEYKRVANQSAPWRVGQMGGGIPISSGNLRERHYTKIQGLEGKFGVSDSKVKYAGYVHEGTYKMEARPWLDYAKNRANKSVEKHYKVFLDNILKFIAT